MGLASRRPCVLEMQVVGGLFPIYSLALAMVFGDGKLLPRLDEMSFQITLDFALFYLTYSFKNFNPNCSFKFLKNSTAEGSLNDVVHRYFPMPICAST